MKKSQTTARSLMFIGAALVLCFTIAGFLGVRYFNSLARSAFEDHLRDISLISCKMDHETAADLCKANNMSFHRIMPHSGGRDSLPVELENIADTVFEEFERDPQLPYVTKEAIQTNRERHVYAFAAARIEASCTSCHEPYGVLQDSKEGDLVGVFGVSTSLESMYDRERKFLLISIPVTILVIYIFVFLIGFVIKKIREVDEQAQVMLDATPLACSFWDDDFIIEDCNLESLRLFDLKDKREFLDGFFDLSPELQPEGCSSKDRFHEMFQQALENGRVVFEWLHRKRDGELIPAEVTLVSVVIGAGKAVVGYTRDLRAEKAKEAKINEAEKRAKIMLEATPLGCGLWDDKFNIINCNLEAARMFGLKNKQMYLERFSDLSPEYQPNGSASAEKSKEMVQMAMDFGRVVFEWMHQKLDGTPVPAEITLVRVENEGGTIVAGYTRDLREAKAAEAKAREADERTKVMFDSMPLGCTLWDESGNLIDCNDGCLRLFEIPNKQEFIDRFFDLSPERQPDGRISTDKVQEFIKYAFEHAGEEIVFEWLHKKLNGDLIPMEVTLIRVKRATRSIIVGYMRDLREVKDKAAQLDIAEKLAYSDSLTGAYNRRYFNQHAAQEFSAQTSKLAHIGIIMFDIDHFKNVNDTWGHEAGDHALKAVAGAAQSALRDTDLFARFGGEEFVVLVQSLDLYSLAKLAERICNKIKAVDFVYDGVQIPITVSAGVAIRKDVGDSVEEVVKHADVALYQAKKNGRDRVEIFHD